MPIRRLPPDLVNRIAAGEVVERPASAMKELIENAVDAGASRIEVQADGGGLQRIAVTDNGSGLNADELLLAIERHATSKLGLDGDDIHDLLRISTRGFRGEALPSIGAVARLTLTSRARGQADAFSLTIDGGRVGKVGPAAFAGPHGATVEAFDLFHATPARLKFMKSERAEAMAIAEEVKRQAMADATIAFALDVDGRKALRLPAEPAGPAGRLARLSAILGREFAANALEIDQERDGIRLTGHAALATYNRGNAAHQFLFVNGRPVRDRLLQGALRAAYADFLSRDRHPAAALYLELDPTMVDVNVHPAKTEVRFRDPAMVRGLMIGALRHALAGAGHRASTGVAASALDRMRPASAAGFSAWRAGGWQSASAEFPDFAGVSARAEPWIGPEVSRVEEDATQFPLGAARAQVHATYIVAQTRDGVVIVDQHAAHERVVLERLRSARTGAAAPAQALLLPIVVDLDPAAAMRVGEAAPELARAGLDLESFGPRAVVVRALPAPLAHADVPTLVRDIADELAQIDASGAVGDRLDRILSTIACHGAIRAGRALDLSEMNALLRAMETTPHAGQCNHGRPTFIELGNREIARLFERS